ncbi:MAG: type I pullulanase [Candidatus Izimaplasma sp.]|nr:type I pullulanase [Candidatus Izimaplasma bacterium]
MRKIKLFLILFMSIIVGYTSIHTNIHASDTTKLFVHYHRFDGNYTPWKLWLWSYEPVAGDGNDYLFNGEDSFGKYFEVDLINSSFKDSTSIGIIVKTSSWDKDVAIDRFIDLTNPNASGEVHAYLVSGDSTIYYDNSAIDVSNRAESVNFITISSIEFKTSKVVTEDFVTLYADGNEVAIKNFVMNGLVGTFDIIGGADLGRSYTLKIDFEDEGYDPKIYNVGFGGLYASDDFNDVYAYNGDLGAIYSNTSTTFKLWAPISENVTLNLYEFGHRENQVDYNSIPGTDDPYETHPLTYTSKGVWEVTVLGDLHGVYYTYSVTNGTVTNEVSDPYAFSAGINGKRSMVVDFERLNPEGWDDLVIPDTIESYNDSIIYELHIRDFTTHPTWNGTEEYRGKFLGLAERGTSYNGVTTGLDHIIELGVTHVQLLPVFDFGAAVDETRLLDPNYSGVKDTIFNWGYMPENFNVVEGSYSTNPYDGSVRITEYKQLIKAFNENNIRVVMDVVYNHTGKSADSNFDLIVPGYYYRMTNSGSFSNGSGTGNETASENYMMRKFMVDSVVFWATEYNIRGFRFDLMKLHDVDTMNAITTALHTIDETILVYGEPWTGGTSQLPEELSAYNATLDQMPGVAVFNDDTRDGIKGSVWTNTDIGFIQGNSSVDERIKLGIVGAVHQTNINLGALPKGAWAPNPNQTVNYVTAHDNNTLFDKIMLSTDDLSWETIKDMQKQANAIILTSQGIPFLYGGVEMMHSKPCTIIGGTPQGECDATLSYDHNSYRSPDSTNQIDWSLKADNMDVFNYYKGLIELRKSINVFSYDSKEEINNKMYFFPDDRGVVSYIIYDDESPWEYTYVIHNNSVVQRNMDLQGMEWNLVVDKDTAGTETIKVLTGDSVTVLPNETLVMYKLANGAVYPPPVQIDPINYLPVDASDSNNNFYIIVGSIVSGVIIVSGTILFYIKRPH